MTRRLIPPLAASTGQAGLLSRAIAAFVLAVLLGLVLAACGPGVGGTGTGQEPASGPVDFGAQPAPVCGSALSASLGCIAVSAPGQAGAEAPTATRWDSVAPGTPAEARIDAQALHLSLRCAGLDFRGTWGVDDQGAGRYFGDVVQAASSAQQRAQVQVVAAATDRLTLTLLDGAGQILAGPLTMAPVDETAASRACP